MSVSSTLSGGSKIKLKIKVSNFKDKTERNRGVKIIFLLTCFCKNTGSLPKFEPTKSLCLMNDTVGSYSPAYYYHLLAGYPFKSANVYK